MKVFKALGAIGMVVLSGACGDERVTTPPPPLTTLLVQPADVSTGTEPELQILVDGPSLATLEIRGDIDRLLSQTELVTWPEGDLVSSRVELVEEPRIEFDLVPTEPLLERWYALRIRLDEHADRFDVQVDEDGVVLRRFYNGSLPLLRVEGAPDVDDIFRLVVVSTERLALGSGVTDVNELVTISTARGPAECGLDSRTSEPLWGRLEYRCAADVGAASVTVNVRPGLVSLTGVPARDRAGRTDAVLMWSPDGTTDDLSAEVLMIHGEGS